jgi:hypothetical protein
VARGGYLCSWETATIVFYDVRQSLLCDPEDGQSRPYWTVARRPADRAQDALALLQRALSLHPDEEAQARVWRAIGKANARTARGLEWHTNQSRKLLAKRPEAPRS